MLIISGSSIYIIINKYKSKNNFLNKYNGK